MSDDACPLPWTPQQWAAVRAVAQESARKSRVASTFLPLDGPVPKDQRAVPANWMDVRELRDRQRGETKERLEVRSGKTLQLVSISSNVYLRGSEAADPELHAAKSMVRRAAEVLGRVEDAIVFNGLPKAGESKIVEPQIYDIRGGRDLTGLLQAPDTLFESLVRATSPEKEKTLDDKEKHLRKKYEEYRRVKEQLRFLEEEIPKTKELTRTKGVSGLVGQAMEVLNECRDEARKVIRANEGASDDVMCVKVPQPSKDDTMPVVAAVNRAVEKLERRGHFGPFAAVFGDELFTDATNPSGTAATLPSERLMAFLDGGPLHRSSTIPRKDGLLIALGGAPVELVVGTDMTVQFVQVTLEPRYVLRVFERFVLRIKELDAVCRITKGDKCLDEDFDLRKADS